MKHKHKRINLDECTHVSTVLINEDKGYRYYDEVTPITDGVSSWSDWYKYNQKEYGRCISPMLVDLNDGSPLQIGWVFEKVCEYEDTGERYHQAAWVCFFKKSDPRVEYPR